MKKKRQALKDKDNGSDKDSSWERCMFCKKAKIKVNFIISKGLEANEKQVNSCCRMGIRKDRGLGGVTASLRQDAGWDWYKKPSSMCVQLPETLP